MALTRVRASQIIGLKGQYAPILNAIFPNSVVPNATTEVTLTGEFFTPDMIISITGQTVNSMKFISTEKITLSVTAGATEGDFNIILNNGISATFVGALLVSIGTVFIPSKDSWTQVTGFANVEQAGTVKLTAYNSTITGLWNPQILDVSKNFYVRFSFNKSPLGPLDSNWMIQNIELRRISDNVKIFGCGGHWSTSQTRYQCWSATDGAIPGPNGPVSGTGGDQTAAADWFASAVADFRFLNGIMYFYLNGVLVYQFTQAVSGNLKIGYNLKNNNLAGIKYIELPN